VAARLTPQHPQALAAPTAELLARLAGRGWAADFYLAGGAATALYLGHREAHGLDLMSGTNRLQPAERRDLLFDLLALESATRVETARDGYLFVHAPGPVAVRFFWYPYPLVDPLEDAAGFAVASALDLALMKLGAAISRGTKRDFVELHLLCRELPLGKVLERAGEKFGHVGDFALQAWKALADPSDAEGDPMPHLTVDLAWEQVRDWARAEAAAGGREALAR